MRLGLISDVHGNLAALEAVLAELDGAGVDAIAFAGDAVSYYPAVNETLDLLRARVRWAITGNHDAYLLGRLPMPPQIVAIANPGHFERAMSAENRAWLAGLPESLDVALDGARLMLRHGSPWAIEEYIHPDHARFDRFAELPADLVVLGHTHRPFVRDVGGVRIVNPGSVGQPRDGDPRASLALVDLPARDVELRRVPYDLEATCRAVVAAGFDERLAAMLRGQKPRW
jgi:putative phosphoesterase